MPKSLGSRVFCSTNPLSYDPLNPGIALLQNGLRLLHSSSLSQRYQVYPDDFGGPERRGIFKLIRVVPDDFGAAGDGLGGQRRKLLPDRLPQFLFGNGGDSVSATVVW